MTLRNHMLLGTEITDMWKHWKW